MPRKSLNVSIPNGLPRPFSRGLQRKYNTKDVKFQSRTGFPGHLAVAKFQQFAEELGVSIPNGLPRPFSPHTVFYHSLLLLRFQSRTGFPGHLAGKVELV